MTTRNTGLIIDDDPDCREMLSLIGQYSGVPMLQAADCAEALRILEREKNRIKIILLDYYMPGMPPKECVTALISTAGPSIPIVLITAAADPASRAAELNLTRWLSKPLDISRLQVLFKEAA